MATLNKVMLIGRVTKDPEPPKTFANTGNTVVRFRFAVGRSKKNEQGGWDKDPNQLYIDCEAFSRPDSKRNLPDLITRYVKGGDPLFIEGRLVFEEWDDKQTGQKRSKHKIILDGLEFLGGRQDGEGGGGGGGASRPAGNSGGGNRSAAPQRQAPRQDDDEEGGGRGDYGGGGSGGDDDKIPF